ncbi:hypothetical protein SH501x_002141 [Pirellulaceae bacterium SH501]
MSSEFHALREDSVVPAPWQNEASIGKPLAALALAAVSDGFQIDSKHRLGNVNGV